MFLLLKIILFPVRLVITIITGVMNLLLASAIINRVFGIVSGLLFLGFLALTWSAVFVQTDMPLFTRILMPCLALLASCIANPLSGVLKYLRLAIARVEGFSKLLKEI
jgi:hypothetical protein